MLSTWAVQEHTIDLKQRTEGKACRCISLTQGIPSPTIKKIVRFMFRFFSSRYVFLPRFRLQLGGDDPIPYREVISQRQAPVTA